MKNKTPDPKQIWEQLEDVLVPRLRLSPIERSVYSHLVRHSRLQGYLRLQFSILELARHLCLSGDPVRQAVRRLVHLGALRLLERSKAGHLVEVRLPGEIIAISSHQPDSHAPQPSPAFHLEQADFTQNKALRQAIHAREGGRCFYCLRRLTPTLLCLDHVVPRVDSGLNSYRNLVSCCLECNSLKAEKPAPDFLRFLYREGRLTAAELTGGLRALETLAAGKLLPVFQDLGTVESKPVKSKPPNPNPPNPNQRREVREPQQIMRKRICSAPKAAAILVPTNPRNVSFWPPTIPGAIIS